MNLLRKHIVRIAVCACALAALGACIPKYTLNGAAIDYTVYHTLRVSNFPIRAALDYPPLQTTFENELLDHITRNTRLKTVDGAADVEMEGEITGYNLTPQAVGEDAYATRTRLTITVRVKYTDNRLDSNSLDQSFSAYRDFDSNELLTDVQDELCTQISKEIVELIFNATIGNW